MSATKKNSNKNAEGNPALQFFAFFVCYLFVFSPLTLYLLFHFNPGLDYASMGTLGRFFFDVSKSVVNSDQITLVISILQGVVAGIAAFLSSRHKRLKFLSWVVLVLLFLALLVGVFVSGQISEVAQGGILSSLFSSDGTQENYAKFVQVAVSLAAAQIGVFVGVRAANTRNDN